MYIYIAFLGGDVIAGYILTEHIGHRFLYRAYKNCFRHKHENRALS